MFRGCYRWNSDPQGTIRRDGAGFPVFKSEFLAEEEGHRLLRQQVVEYVEARPELLQEILELEGPDWLEKQKLNKTYSDSHVIRILTEEGLR